MRVKFPILLILPAIVGFSCVPTKQYHDLEGKMNEVSEERNELFSENEKLTVDNAEMKAMIDRMEEEVEDMNAERSSLREEYEDLKMVYDELDRRYNDLKDSQEALLTGHNRETRRLLNELQKAQADLLAKEDRLRELEENTSRKMVDLENLRAQLEQRNQRLVELEQMLNAKDAQMKALKETITEALYGFEQEGLSVFTKDGKLYVSMDEKLLFQTGSIVVDPRGVEALKTLAGVLEKNPDIDITIEGHTDDVPVRANASFADNWDLSVKRATSIVRILLDNSSIDPTRLVASGRGEFLPVDPAGTPQARQKNRRTEIILTPNLGELYNLLDSN